MKKNWIRISATLAAFAAACALVWAISAPPTQSTTIAVKPGSQIAHLLRSDFKHPAPPPPAPVVEAAPVYEDPGPSITYCPSGTVAGAVDSYGNESNCYETNNSGQTCAAYDDANNCTAWYQP